MTSTYTNSFDPTTVTHLADILVDAHRAAPEDLAEIIADAEWHGTPDNAEDQAVGHYIANHLNIANPGRRHLVWVQHHTVTVLDLITNVVLAESELTGGIADLADLIGEGDEEFAHLHQPEELEMARMTPTDREELAERMAFPVARSGAHDFLPAITALRESITA